MRPLKQQASLQAHNLARKHKLVGVGHCFGKVSVLATMPGNFHPKKLKWTSNADQLKFNGRVVQIDMNIIGQAIIAFVCSQLCNVCESQELLASLTHKIQYQTSSWHRGNSSYISLCGRMCKSQHWHILASLLEWCS